jgi:hypothetical protein
MTEKHKDGRIYHLLAAKELPEFHYDLPQTACAQFVCAPQFFKTPKGLCGHMVLTGKHLSDNFPI